MFLVSTVKNPKLFSCFDFVLFLQFLLLCVHQTIISRWRQSIELCIVYRDMTYKYWDMNKAPYPCAPVCYFHAAIISQLSLSGWDGLCWILVLIFCPYAKYFSVLHQESMPVFGLASDPVWVSCGQLSQAFPLNSWDLLLSLGGSSPLFCIIVLAPSACLLSWIYVSFLCCLLLDPLSVDSNSWRWEVIDLELQ